VRLQCENESNSGRSATLLLVQWSEWWEDDADATPLMANIFRAGERRQIDDAVRIAYIEL